MLADIRAQFAHARRGCGEVDLWFSCERHSELRAAARLMCRARGANHALRRRTADVETIATHEIALDERDLGAKSCGSGGAHQSRGAGAQNDQVVSSRWRRVEPSRRMTIAEQSLIMIVAGQDHLLERHGLVVRIQARLSQNDAAFFSLFRFAQSPARNPRDNDEQRNRRRKPEVLENLLIEVGGIPGERVPSRRADVDEQKHRRQHADQIGQDVSPRTDGR